MNLKQLSACAAVLVATVAGASTAAAADVNSTKLRKAVKAQNVFEHQASLETIANANGNTRHTETQGFEASVDYVLGKLESYGYDPEVVQFNMPEWVENSTPALTRTDVDPDKSYVPGTADDDDSPDVDFISVELSPSANLTDVPVVPTNDILVPSPGGSTSGCEAEDYPAAVSGAVALIQRGTCPFVQKLQMAQDAGAVGVIIFNEGDTPERQNALFVSGPTGLEIPAVVSSFAVGNELYQAYQAGENPTVSLTIDADINDRFFPQVLAETKTGDPKHAVVVGAHLDSVEAGPGINDDGSGTSAQLEIAKQIASKDLKPRQQIRFAWWGGEEDGLIGSTYYAEHLNPREVAKIMVMLDFDMISSANFARLVYDGDGSVETTRRGRPVRARSSACSPTSGSPRGCRRSRSRSTVAPTTSGSPTSASRPAASSPARRSRRRPSRRRSTAARRASSSTRATTTTATGSRPSSACRRWTCSPIRSRRRRWRGAGRGRCASSCPR